MWHWFVLPSLSRDRGVCEFRVVLDGFEDLEVVPDARGKLEALESWEGSNDVQDKWCERSSISSDHYFPITK